MIQLVPLTNAPNDTFNITLSVNGVSVVYKLTFRYNEVAQYWVMTVQDSSGDILVDSIPLVTGNGAICNLLNQLNYLNLGSAYVINASGVASPNYPNNLDLGTDFVLLWGDTA